MNIWETNVERLTDLVFNYAPQGQRYAKLDMIDAEDIAKSLAASGVFAVPEGYEIESLRHPRDSGTT